MTTKTEKVDVLTVMDLLIKPIREVAKGQTAEQPTHAWLSTCEDARDAVAELIEAIEDDAAGYAVVAEMGVSEWRSFVPHRTAKALVRIGGAK